MLTFHNAEAVLVVRDLQEIRTRPPYINLGTAPFMHTEIHCWRTGINWRRADQNIQGKYTLETFLKHLAPNGRQCSFKITITGGELVMTGKKIQLVESSIVIGELLKK